MEHDTTNNKPECVVYNAVGSTANIIENNVIVYSGALATGLSLIEGGGGFDMKVLNNHITIDGAVADSPHDVIKFANTTSPANYAVCMGNTIIVRNVGNAPDIDPATVVGYSLNHLINNASEGITT